METSESKRSFMFTRVEYSKVQLRVALHTVSELPRGDLQKLSVCFHSID